MSVYVAFYKGRAKSVRDVRKHILDMLIRVGTHGDYSHCEMVLDVGNGLYSCMSSSPRDGGVRQKLMTLPSDRWDLIPVNVSVSDVLAFYAKHKGKRYDWGGITTFLLPFVNRYHSPEQQQISSRSRRSQRRPTNSRFFSAGSGPQQQPSPSGSASVFPL